jgi:hypothetical protein
MPKKNPRNNGLSGSPLHKLKYNYLRDRGVPSTYATQFRKNDWDKIDQVIDLYEKGAISQVTIKNKKLKEREKRNQSKKAAVKKPKEKPRKETKKPSPKRVKVDPPQAPPKGYHWRFYKRSGEWGLAKNPPPRDSVEITPDFPKVLVFWRDQTGDIDGEEILKAIRSNNRKGIKYLLTDIKGGKGEGYYDQDWGHIGAIKTHIAKNEREVQAYLSLYAGWTLIYADYPRYKSLLSVLATIGVYIYESDKKKDAGNLIALNVRKINPELGKQLLNDVPR